MIEVREFVDSAGRSSFRRWFDRLDPTTQARITIALDRLERGSTSAAKSLGTGIHELRLDFGPGFRIYFGWDGATLVILLGGGTKKRQATDIASAKELWREYKLSKRETS